MCYLNFNGENHLRCSNYPIRIKSKLNFDPHLCLYLFLYCCLSLLPFNRDTFQLQKKQLFGVFPKLRNNCSVFFQNIKQITLWVTFFLHTRFSFFLLHFTKLYKDILLHKMFGWLMLNNIKLLSITSTKQH